MKTSMIVKLNFLLLALGVTVYLSYNLNKNGLSPGVKSVLGIENNTGNFKWNWCRNRVAGLILPEKFKIAQVGNTWVLEDQTKKVLDFISVEKWLANFCAVDASYTETQSRAGFMPAVIIKYITGEIEILHRSSQGTFLWRNKVFRSPEFDEGLESLGQLPVKNPSTGAAK